MMVEVEVDGPSSIHIVEQFGSLPFCNHATPNNVNRTCSTTKSPMTRSLAVGDILNMAARSGVGLGNGGKGHGEPVRVDDVSSETHAPDPRCHTYNMVGLVVPLFPY
jgi:hypothetical protein